MPAKRKLDWRDGDSKAVGEGLINFNQGQVKVDQLDGH